MSNVFQELFFSKNTKAKSTGVIIVFATQQ